MSVGYEGGKNSVIKGQLIKPINLNEVNYIIINAKIEAAKWTIDDEVTNLIVRENYISNSYINENSIIELHPGKNITYEQKLAFSNANIVFKSQENGKIKFWCYGEVPNVDIPIELVIRSWYTTYT